MMKKQMLFNGLFLSMIWLLLAAPTASRAATSKRSASSAKSVNHHIIARNPYLGAIVVDAGTGKVLFEDQADARGYPASILKLMDLLIILEKVEQGQLSLQDQVPVSAKAASAAPSNVGLVEKESFAIDEMLYALMIRSANDAAV